MNADNRRKGYTSITLGGTLIKKIDAQGKSGGINRSLMIRLILDQYYKLKEKGVDILKKDVDEIVEKLKVRK